jgi:hypothetical protein
LQPENHPAEAPNPAYPSAKRKPRESLEVVNHPVCVKNCRISGKILLMKEKVTHDRQEETPEAKARWFQSLTVEERGDLLNLYTDLILEVNPRLMEQKSAQPVAGRIRLVSKT